MYLYNSATHKKEEFKTHTPGHVEMYTCGPTVYHFAQHHGTGGDAGVVTHLEGAQDLRAGAHQDIVAQRGVALSLILAGTTQCDALVQQAVVADLRRLADDDAHAVVDDQAVADGGTGVDLDAGPEPAPLGHAPGQEKPVVDIQPMGQPVIEDGVDAGVQEKDLQLAAGRGVAALIGGQQAAQTGHSLYHIELTPCVGREEIKAPPVPKYERRRIAVPLSFITQGGH